MNKRFVIRIVIIVIVMVLLFAIFNKCSRNFVDSTNINTESMTINTKKTIVYEYNLDEAPEKYGVRTSKKDRKEYFEYLKQCIKPIKLLNFISERDLESDFYNISGHKMIDWLLHKGYNYMFESMFDINRTDFNDCAVTENFIEKFNTNLNSYFDIGGEDCNIEVYTDDRTIKYKKWWNLGPDGDPANGWLYVFKYTLDEEGNVDDIVLDYTTGDF